MQGIPNDKTALQEALPLRGSNPTIADILDKLIKNPPIPHGQAMGNLDQMKAHAKKIEERDALRAGLFKQLKTELGYFKV